MYRVLFLPIIFFVLSFSAYGQIEMGVKIGPNLSRSVFDDPEYKSFTRSRFRPGFQGGLVFVFENPKNDKYALQTEIYYSQIKRKVVSEYNHFSGNSAKYDYLHWPLMFRIRFKSEGFEWYAVLGPQVSYWLGGHGQMDRFDPSSGGVSYPYKINFKEPIDEFDRLNATDVNRFQLGLTAGVGWYYEINDSDRLAASLRYYFGHSYMGKRQGGEIPHLGYFENYESINQALELSVIYTLDIYQKARFMRKKFYK